MTANALQFEIPHNLTAQAVADLMVTVVEGNHMTRSWCNGIYLGGDLADKEGEWKTKENYPWYANPDIYAHPHLILVVEEIVDESKAAEGDNIKAHQVTRENMVKALKEMARHHATAFNNIMSGDYDIYDADVFIQLAALNEVVYG